MGTLAKLFPTGCMCCTTGSFRDPKVSVCLMHLYVVSTYDARDDLLRQAMDHLDLLRDAGVAMPDGWSGDNDELIDEIRYALAVKP